LAFTDESATCDACDRVYAKHGPYWDFVA
jgi:hypothetical protein